MAKRSSKSSWISSSFDDDLPPRKTARYEEIKQPALSTANLAVDSRKVKEVRNWLKGHINHCRLLFLVGPSGSGRSSTLRCLCSEMGYEIVEWSTSSTMSYRHVEYRDGLSKLFQDFVLRTGRFQSFVQRIILVEELPFSLNYYDEKQHKFGSDILETILRLFCQRCVCPLVFVLNSSLYDLFGNRSQELSSMIDEIKFNPINDRVMKKFLSTQSASKSLAEQVLNAAHGDVRAACNLMEFHSQRPRSSRSRQEKLNETRPTISSVDTKIDLFSFVGKVLYAKRTTDLEETDLILRADLRRCRLENNPETIMEKLSNSYSDERLIDFISENYIDFKAELSSVRSISDYLSFCDVLNNDWQSPLTNLSGLLAFRCVGFFGTTKRLGYHSFRKPRKLTAARSPQDRDSCFDDPERFWFANDLPTDSLVCRLAHSMEAAMEVDESSFPYQIEDSSDEDSR